MNKGESVLRITLQLPLKPILWRLPIIGTERRGERGSPYSNPLLPSKNPLGTPFTNILIKKKKKNPFTNIEK